MTKQAATWQNRIVGTGTARADSLLANEKNWRIHPRPQQDALGGVLGEVGWVQQVIVNKRTAGAWGRDQNVETLVDGHLRVTMALRQGDDTPVPVVYVDLSPDEEALVLATLDPLSAMAVHDKDKLDQLLREVETGDAAVQQMLSELAAREGIVPPNVEFKEYDESVENEVEYLTCPECGHKWPK